MCVGGESACVRACVCVCVCNSNAIWLLKLWFELLVIIQVLFAVSSWVSVTSRFKFEFCTAARQVRF